ncbi:motility protein MotB, partial [Pseudomonas aeruginosa]
PTYIVVLTRKAQKAIEGETGAPAAAPGEQPKPAAEAPAAGAQPSLPADEVQKKLNLFDDGGSLKLEQIKGD